MAADRWQQNSVVAAKSTQQLQLKPLLLVVADPSLDTMERKDVRSKCSNFHGIRPTSQSQDLAL
jgi:hypothetical protein